MGFEVWGLGFGFSDLEFLGSGLEFEATVNPKPQNAK